MVRNDLVLTVGEVLWDVLPDGPELGGAPLNMAVHLGRLGRRSAILTAVGADEAGRRARREILELGVDVAWVQTSPRLPTGTADVRLDGATPTFDIVRPAPYDDLRLDQVGRPSPL
jgi:fructokinase